MITRKRIFAVTILLLIIGLTIWIYFEYGKDLVKFISDRERFKGWIDSLGYWGWLAIVGLAVLQVLIAVLPAGPFQIAAGYVYGPLLGTFLYVLGATFAALIVLLLVRVFGTRLVKLFVSQEKIDSYSFIHDSDKVARVLFVIFLIPGTPKDVLTYIAGLTDVKIGPWIVINIVGRFPAAVLTILCGHALGQKNYFHAGLYIGIAALICIVGALCYGIYLKKRKSK